MPCDESPVTNYVSACFFVQGARHNQWRRLHGARGGHAPNFYKWSDSGGHREWKNCPELLITKTLTKTTLYL